MTSPLSWLVGWLVGWLVVLFDHGVFLSSATDVMRNRLRKRTLLKATSTRPPLPCSHPFRAPPRREAVRADFWSTLF
jgi:hypothetical protein